MDKFLKETIYKAFRIFEDADVTINMNQYKSPTTFLSIDKLNMGTYSDGSRYVYIQYLDAYNFSKKDEIVSEKDLYLVCRKFKFKSGSEESLSKKYFGTDVLSDVVFYDYDNRYTRALGAGNSRTMMFYKGTFSHNIALVDLEEIPDKNLSREEFSELLKTIELEARNDFPKKENITETTKFYSLKTFHPDGMYNTTFFHSVFDPLPEDQRFIVDTDNIIEATNLLNSSRVTVNNYRYLARRVLPIYHTMSNYDISINDLVEVEVDLETMKISSRPEPIVPFYFRFHTLQPEDLKSNIPVDYITRSRTFLSFQDEYYHLNVKTGSAQPVDDVAEANALYSKEIHQHVLFDDLEQFDPDNPNDTRPDRIYWTRPITKKYDIYKDYLIDQIRTRYAMYNLPRNGLKNVIIDSCVPKLLYATNFDVARARGVLNAPKTASAISPWFANMFGVRQVPPEQLLRILGYDKKMLTKLIKDVSSKKYEIMFIGFGGTCINTVTWLDEIMKMTNQVNLFKSVTVVEPDKVELSNLLRFPIDPTTIHDTSRGASKLSLAGDRFNRLSNESPMFIEKRYSPTLNDDLHTSFFHLYEYDRDDEGNLLFEEDGTTVKIKDVQIASDKHIIYGAPNIDTRAELSPYGNFISATHGGEECSLWLNPEHSNTSLQVESYGVIQLSSFFMNQIRMAVGFLEMLADPNLDFQTQDAEYLNYKFDGIPVKSTDFTYNFQLQHSGTITTEAEARTI